MSSHTSEFSRWDFDADTNTYWCRMHPAPEHTPVGYRPCFSLTLMHEIRDGFDEHVIKKLQGDDLAHLVIASNSSVFNLGGDLEHFSRLIRSQDKSALRAYAHHCVESVHMLHNGFDKGVHTIALVEGNALGGGFELALACNTLVAEKGTKMGFPESMFGLFPGMGAYSFLRQRLPQREAERLLFDTDSHSSEELYEMGVVDVLAEKGEGPRETLELIRRHRRVQHARKAVDAARALIQPVTLDELMGITNLWAEAAMALTPANLKMMDRLVKKQRKLEEGRGTHRSDAPDADATAALPDLPEPFIAATLDPTSGLSERRGPQRRASA